MLIRSFQRRDMRKKRIFWTLLAVLVILLIWIIGGNIQEYYHQQSLLPVQSLTIGQTMSFEGTVNATNKFPIYTHTVYNKDGVKIFLKSSSVNLNAYEGQYVSLKGNIKEIYKGAPIVDVSEVKIANEGLAIKDNTYIFSKDLLVLDFKDQSQLSAKRTDREIEVYYGAKKIFTIERFACNKIYKSGNCDELISDYEKNQKDSFDCYRGYTYYKHGTGLRTVFDGNQFGYIFKNVEDSILLDISSNIKIIDAENLISIQEKQINEACGYTTILGGDILDKQEDSIRAQFEGQKNNEQYNCTITFDTSNERKISDIEK